MERREVGVVGFGTSICVGMFPSLARYKYLKPFLDKEPVFLDAGPEDAPLPLGQYKNFANSSARTFVGSNIDPYNRYLRFSDEARGIKQASREGRAIRLSELKDYFALCKDLALRTVEDSPAKVRFDTKVHSLEKSGGGFVLHDAEGPFLEVDKLVMATGSREVPDIILQALAEERFQLSTEVLRGNLSRIAEIEGDDPEDIVLVGSSHAAAAVMQLMGWEGVNRPVSVVSRGVKVYSGMGNHYSGVRLCRERFRAMKEEKGKDKLIRVERDFIEAVPEIKRAKLVIQCLGMTPIVPYDVHRKGPFFDLKDGYPKMDKIRQTLYRGGRPTSTAWGIGIGFASKMSQCTGRQADIDAFRAHAPMIVKQILGLDK